MPQRSDWAPFEGSTRRARLPEDWPARREAVFRRDGDTCHVCLLPGADEVDHVVPGDDHRLENLAPIHSWRTPQRCHALKTSAEGNAARPRLYRTPERHPGLR
ncbi:HNH endonuclease [Micromonospora fluostatini]|uniref:HNH endonuclease n=1 Tax=Micromonospora fluostatini TaxID=1629071 RepID=A0ABY2DME6_9ACTN|nr:HNH endonuclease [Micromonospora fluostatini]